ncbi:Kelch repeat-containing protein [Maribacter halichondriae]|uniref:Kelch repeat-containing protein n=1 Tax=Maribacter halichondriae TaxID=2980554 RepID=UPI0023585C5C|nr:kelch repeat-containing protein [Maribacter sp. Hal144]
MKKYILIIAILLSGFSMGCKKNDDSAPMQMALQNEPPLSFDLINVPDNAEDVDVTPTLSWESAKNPKGSKVTYDLYLGTEVNPTTLFQGDSNDASFEITDRLHLLTDYYWKVVAKDTDGKISQSPIHKFTTRNITLPNEPVTAAADFSPRGGHASVVFDNKMWVIGGYDMDSKNDVWYSNDGVNWTEATPVAAFEERAGHASVVFDGKIWIIGGSDNSAKNDVWFNANGVDWEMATATAEFSARFGHTAVVFENKIWVIGGVGNGSVFSNDVWYSHDGIDWELATDSAPFSKRSGHVSVIFDNKLWVIGGTGSGLGEHKNDVWFSSDGLNWTKATSIAAFEERSGHASVVYDGKIWIIGGYEDETNGGYKKDVWYSIDGTNWDLATTDYIEWFRHTSVVFQDNIWIVGGESTDGRKNEVWAMD